MELRFDFLAIIIPVAVVAALLLVIIVGVTYQYRFAKKTNKIITSERNKSEQLLLNILPAVSNIELVTIQN